MHSDPPIPSPKPKSAMQLARILLAHKDEFLNYPTGQDDYPPIEFGAPKGEFEIAEQCLIMSHILNRMGHDSRSTGQMMSVTVNPDRRRGVIANAFLVGDETSEDAVLMNMDGVTGGDKIVQEKAWHTFPGDTTVRWQLHGEWTNQDHGIDANRTGYHLIEHAIQCGVAFLSSLDLAASTTTATHQRSAPRL